MTRGRIEDYFIGKDYNCAEAVLRAFSDEHGLDIPEEAFRLIGGFGGGMACGRTCGALCGGCAALSYVTIQDRAHTSPQLKAAVSGYAEAFAEEFGSDSCGELMKTYKKPETRCLDMICRAADLLDECFEKTKE